MEINTNSMTIPCHLSKFYLFSMLEHDMDFGQVQVMAFAKKMMGFPSYLILGLILTKLPSKRHEEVHVAFFTGMVQIYGGSNLSTGCV